MKKNAIYELLLIIVTVAMIIIASYAVVMTLSVKYTEKNALKELKVFDKISKEDEKFLNEYLEKVSDIFIETAISDNKESIITQGEEGIEFAIQYILKNESIFQNRIIKSGTKYEVKDEGKKHIAIKYVDGLTIIEILKQFFPDYNYNVKESKYYDKEQKLVALVNKNNNKVDETASKIIQIVGDKDRGYVIKTEYTNRLKNTEEKFQVDYIFKKDATIKNNYYISKVIYYKKI
ncbi:MAG: hypothetical protein PHR25_01315 [Clostridia bacterium]|nr:hypothetical protein [Clostridia bacterium]MDD4375406.1 hypothetical protein [Clostridia bacterium]